MSQRVCLYTASAEGQGLRFLSEYPYTVPISFYLLVSAETRVGDDRLIYGRLDEGVARLQRVVKTLAASEAFLARAFGRSFQDRVLQRTGEGRRLALTEGFAKLEQALESRTEGLMAIDTSELDAMAGSDDLSYHEGLIAGCTTWADAIDPESAHVWPPDVEDLDVFGLDFWATR